MNKKQSCIFVKRMLAISVSTITYMRNMFPEAAFVDKKLEGKKKHCNIFTSYWLLTSSS